jgi:pyruvate formate lyase activating enzyme
MAEQIQGLVNKIQGSSFVDGPGVRTTVFLKGCPLRCLWCCDPEGQHLFPEENKLYPQKGVNQIFGEWMTAEEVVETVAKDIPFYRASGGGVTIAGGEPTYQPTFCREVIRRCKALGIHTALDTCGHTVDEEAVRTLEEADLLLFDLKHMDPAQHALHTGASNTIILSNFRRMMELGKETIIRVPLIPGYTDTASNIRAIGHFIHSLGQRHVIQIDLLPYNRGGIIRYEMLGQKYPLGENLARQSEGYLKGIRDMLTEILGGSCPVNIGY